MATLTVFPDAGSGATTVDGNIQRSGVDEAFGTIRGGAGTTANTTLASPMTKVTSSATSNQYTEIRRCIFTFDTSALTSSATISAAVLSLKGVDAYTTFSTSPEIDIVASTPAANNTLATGDYAQLGATPFSSITLAGYSTSAYNDFTLDAGGIANISKTSISKFGCRVNWDTDNSAPTWGNSQEGAFQFASADTAGTTSDPKLVITYTIASASVHYLLTLGVG